VDELVSVLEDAAGVIDGAALDLQIRVDLAQLVVKVCAVAGGRFLAAASEAEEAATARLRSQQTQQ
jgi:hypothetical protein